MNNEEIRDENREEIPENREAEAENNQNPEAGDQQEEKQATDQSSEEKQTEEPEKSKETSEEDEAASAKYMRLMADFQNYKRRVEKEKGDIYAYANEKIVTELLTVMDNFERALQHEAAEDSFGEGMRMIFKQLAGVLEKAGLEEIKALGEDFDPKFHNAVMTEDNADYESGKVTEVMQKGYLLNKKVIRPSMVKVNN